MMILGLAVSLLHLSLSNAANTAVTCLSCVDVAAPSDCRQTMICGKGEICYTREFTDHRGLQAFSLGCEGETRCNLFLNAQHLFGKRDGFNFDPAPSGECYECCTTEECNGNLCQDKGGVHVSLTPTTATPCPTCTCSKTTCPTSAPCPQTTIAHQAGPGFPPFAVAYKDKYYLFSYVDTDWETARNSCKSYGADLVSINAQDEQEFLTQHLNKSGTPTNVCSYWTGGTYSHSFHEWEWVDRSPVLYTHWFSGQPGTLSHNTDYHIRMLNPSCFSTSRYKDGQWHSTTAGDLPFICEKQKM